MQQESPQIADVYTGARPLAVWPARKAASGIGALFLVAGIVAATWMPGSPLRGLALPTGSLPGFAAPVTGPAVPAAAVDPPAAAAPAAPLAASVPAPANLAVIEAPVAPAPAPEASRSAWQAPDVYRIAYPQRVERWRPLVRFILAEMWDEGRLDGHAARLDDDLVLALIEQESAGSPNATSWVGAIGLMQVMPFTFADMMAGDKGLADQIDPAEMYDLTSNVRAGLRYLALAMQAHEGNVYWALAAYNGGIEAVDAWRAVGLYAVPPIGGYEETANYAQVILHNYLRHRPDVKIYVPDPMPYEHVPGAVELLLQAGRY